MAIKMSFIDVNLALQVTDSGFAIKCSAYMCYGSGQCALDHQ